MGTTYMITNEDVEVQADQSNGSGPKEALYLGVIEQIRDLIRSSHYKPGDILPSEGDLAILFGVSRGSIREAMRALGALGVIDSRHGARATVCRDGSRVLDLPLDFLVAVEQPSRAAFAEMRETLEVMAAGLAAERRTEEDLCHIEEALAAIRRPHKDAEAESAANRAFHRAIASAAHNPILERIHGSLLEIRGLWIRGDFPQVPRNVWVANDDVHERIVDAIRRGSVSDARRAMRMDMAMAAIAAEQYLKEEFLKGERWASGLPPIE